MTYLKPILQFLILVQNGRFPSSTAAFTPKSFKVTRRHPGAGPLDAF